MIALALLAAGAAAVPPRVPTAAIERAMADSAAGWNAGDLDRFMRVYAPDATYVTARGLVRGKALIAERYRPAFAGGGNKRGRLGFTNTSFRAIDPRHVLMWARWWLVKRHGRPETGMTTLVFEHRREGWRIVSDHSS